MKPEEIRGNIPRPVIIKERKKKKVNYGKQISARISNETYDFIKKYCEKYHWKKQSDLIRVIVNDRYNENKYLFE